MNRQEEFKLYGGMRLCNPQSVPTDLLKKANTWREACRYCLSLSPIKMTYRAIAERGGFTYQHVSDWFHKDDKPTRRSMPAHCINDFEWIVGNTFLTQWLAAHSNLTVMEEVQANIQEQRRAA